MLLQFVGSQEGHLRLVPMTTDPTSEPARRFGGREFEERDASSRTEDAIHLLQHPSLILHVVERNHGDDPVE